MSTEIIFKKTKDLSVAERRQIRDLYNRVFGKERNIEWFEQRFLCSTKGYAYHGLLLHENTVVGSFTAIPYRYNYFGRELTFGLSVDTMIAPEHRGGKATLVNMADLVYQALIDDGIPFIYGFPNERFYGHEKKILGTRDISRLNFYVLPRNIGAVIPKMKPLNGLSRLFAGVITGLPTIRRAADYRYNIEKVNDKEFEKHRYDDTYSTIELGGGAKCIYKIYEEERDVKTLYVIDVVPLTTGAFKEAIKRLYRTAAKSVDLIIYVGKLPFMSMPLIRIPRSLEPQKVMMTGKILLSEVVDESVFTVENWNVNISNFDVR
jgi:hypothetical protein